MQLAPLIYRPGQMAAHAPGGCWTCVHYRGELVARGAHTVCRQVPDRPNVIASPRGGCAFWEREVGSDDEIAVDWPPQQ
jgi:hypothetical protein